MVEIKSRILNKKTMQFDQIHVVKHRKNPFNTVVSDNRNNPKICALSAYLIGIDLMMTAIICSIDSLYLHS